MSALSQFATDRPAFLHRMEEQLHDDREACAVAKAHLLAFARRMAHAMRALEEGNAGTARSYLNIGQNDYSAAINALPQ